MVVVAFADVEAAVVVVEELLLPQKKKRCNVSLSIAKNLSDIISAMLKSKFSLSWPYFVLFSFLRKRLDGYFLKVSALCDRPHAGVRWLFPSAKIFLWLAANSLCQLFKVIVTCSC